MGIAEHVKISEPQWLLLIFALVVLLPALNRLSHSVAHTYTGMHKLPSVGWLSLLCKSLFAAFWISLSVAVAGLQVATSEQQDIFLSRDTIVGLDRSSSMDGVIEDKDLLAKIEAFESAEKQALEELRARHPDLFSSDQPVNPEDEVPEEKKPDQKKEKKGPTRFQLARWAAIQYFESRPKGDRSGMFTFDDEPYFVWPLGSDINVVVERVHKLRRKEGGGTNFEGPTESDPRVGAFQACINHFNKLGQAKTRVMILISDGEAGISPERREQLREQMKKEGQEIHIYCLVVAEKEKMDNKDTQSLRDFTKEINPKDFPEAVIWAGDAKAMQKAFADINLLERSVVKSEPVLRFHDVSVYGVAAGCVFLGLFMACAALFRENF